ncbi:MAG TPA: hypothetical protein VGM44_12150 [Polyangiaceae bacterium]
MLAEMRHSDAARAAVKKRLAEFFLELLDDARDDLRRDAEPDGRLAEVRALRRHAKHT